MDSPTDLNALAEEFLAACVAALNTIPGYEPELGGAPARSFVAPGAPAFDCCPQLTVHVSQIGEGSMAPESPVASKFRINRPTFIATVIRCVPMPSSNGQPPPVADQAAAAKQILADEWALWNHIWNRIRAGLLFALCNDVVWNGLTTLTPQGGCGGLTLNITAALNGYEEIFGT